ncbi:MAG TPA: hypothetical protein VG426_11290 [Candidatus Dormibacteraeota bacterium]|nr:hypothetical protein [Candidatus Dormibacteraeota bacterium]
MPAPRTLPAWAVTTVRIFLAAQGLIAAPVAIIAILLRIATRYCYTDSYCELNDIVLGLLALMTLGFAAVAVAGAWWLRRDRFRGVVAFGVAAASTSGCAVTVVTMRASSAAAAGTAYYSLELFQFWAAWPLVIWPAVGVLVTILLILLLGGVASRIARTVWPVACLVLSAFFLTYLLPADDLRVARLHGLGLVTLPRSAGTIMDSSGRQVITRGLDPMIYLSNGLYITNIWPGDYVVTEGCYTPPDKYSDATVSIHVDLGRDTLVTDRCASS